jgi:uncharacterized RDD family membrane protein YckC
MAATHQPDPLGTDPVRGPSGPRAGFWRRFAAALLDGVLLSVVSVVLGIVLAAAASFAVSLIIGIAYYVLFEGGPRGQTPGKSALSIRVIDFGQGGSIGYGRAFIRYIGRIVSSFFLFLGYFWMLWDKERQTWHDKMANAVVVPTNHYRVD